MDYRNRVFTSRCKTLLAVVLTVLATSSCVEGDLFEDNGQALTADGVAIIPSVWNMSNKTRAVDYYDNVDWGTEENDDESDIDADDDLKESDLGTTLDVFIAGITDPSFWKQYHLVKGVQHAGTAAKVQNGTLDVLATGKWMQSEGYQAGHDYDVYVAVNNTATNADIGSKEELLNLTYTNLEVDKIYPAKDENDNPLVQGATSASRKMMMDGHTVWTANSEQRQTINIDLKRAEAKIVANVKFDPAFVKTKQADGVTIGDLAWKYVNWNQTTKVFAEAEPIALEDLELETHDEREYATRTGDETSSDYYYHTDANDNKSYYSSFDVVEEDNKYYHYQPSDVPGGEHTKIEVKKGTEEVTIPVYDIITYTYAFDWGDNPLDYAPNILVSFGYTKGASTSFNYYRIPIVDEAVIHELKRNHIYKVNAIISGNGSASLEENPNDLRLFYEVVDWTERTDLHNTVKGDRFYFFLLEPTQYNLYGGTTANPTKQQVISYSAHGDAQVRLKDIEVYYYNNDGTVSIQTVAGGDNTTSVRLINSEKGYNYSISVDNENQQITVTSDMLKNHAVKYIKFKAYAADQTDWESEGFYANVTVKHFPIDNIQSIKGRWSSRWDGVSVEQREYTFDLATAQSWGTYYTEEIEVSANDTYDRTETNNDGTPANHDATDYRVNYSTGQNGSNVQQQYREYVSQGVNRYRTNGENNAARGNDGYWYWGTDEYYIGTNGNTYDWRTNYWGEVINNGNYRYRWTNYHRSQYKKTHYYRTRYYRVIGVQDPSTGDWTDYIKKTGSKYEGVNYNGDYSNSSYGFRAKWFDDNTQTCKRLNANGNATSTDAGVSKRNNKNNNNMYVIQITATSSDYVIGRPTIDGNYQSDDHVVSPAFMIASQLGAVASAAFNASRAATHCGTYMEVATDGTRYVGWRLPTAEEVKVIIQYQSDPSVVADETMDVVLGGANYYTLSGGSQATGVEAGNDTYVRCIRDLSAEEVEALNNKGN